MILLDANLLIYAKIASSPQHSMARAWLESVLGGPARVGLPWPSLLAFVRITSNPRVFARALSTSDAWAQVQEWAALPAVWIPQPSEHHAAVLSRAMVHAATSKLVPDAHLAALAMEHGLELCSTDGDFARFPGLRWKNPLMP